MFLPLDVGHDVMHTCTRLKWCCISASPYWLLLNSAALGTTSPQQSYGSPPGRWWLWLGQPHNPGRTDPSWGAVPSTQQQWYGNTPPTGGTSSPQHHITVSDEGIPPPALPTPVRPPRSRAAAELAALAQRLDIIPPEEIQVLRLLGSGSYGEVYLAKWNESDVAVKCLNARHVEC